MAQAKLKIESWLGVRLTNIELAGLNNLAKQVFAEVERNERDNINGASQFEAHKEIPARFLSQFYGIQGEDQLRKFFPPEKGENGKMVWPTAYMHEYFKREQAKLHNEL